MDMDMGMDTFQDMHYVNGADTMDNLEEGDERPEVRAFEIENEFKITSQPFFIVVFVVLMILIFGYLYSHQHPPVVMVDLRERVQWFGNEGLGLTRTP